MFEGLVLIFAAIILIADGSSGFHLVDSSRTYITTGGQEGLLLFNEGTVCHSSFNLTSAQAICKVMGFKGALGWTSGLKWKIQPTFSIHINNVICPHPNWSSCTYKNANCNHGGDVFLTCSGSRSPFSLVDTRGYTVSGSQEFLLLYNGGTVCGDSFSNNSAEAVCRDMGYPGAESWRVGMCWNSGSYRIAMYDMNCTGSNLNSCSYTTSHNCLHGKDVFISCKSSQVNITLDSSRGVKHLDKKTEDNELRSCVEQSVSEAGENLAVAILTLICTVLVFLLVKKNTQIDQKDSQIAALIKKLEKVDHFEELLTKMEAHKKQRSSSISKVD